MAFNQATADAMLAALEEGASLRSAARDSGIDPSTFLKWCDADEALAQQYARARARGIDMQFEELDELQSEEPDRPEGKVDPAWVAWRRLQIDTRKWALSKRAPKKYGDKLDVEHKGAFSVQLQAQDREL